MSARIFISCGQRPGPEKEFCERIKPILEAKGFQVYISIEVMSILDLNRGIISALKNSDYYLFVNFPREEVSIGSDNWRRGSLYTNQELAIAIASGFENCLFINHKDAKKEGIHEYLVSNVADFDSVDDLISKTESSIATAGWQPNFSRHLTLDGLRWGPVVEFSDHTGDRTIRVLHGDIKNLRSDSCAYGVVARLKTIAASWHSAQPSADQSLLKASGFTGFEHVIFPNDRVSFDLAALTVGTEPAAFLNSGMDVHPRNPICNKGAYTLLYEIASSGYPTLRFEIDLSVVDAFNEPPVPTFRVI